MGNESWDGICQRCGHQHPVRPPEDYPPEDHPNGYGELLGLSDEEGFRVFIHALRRGLCTQCQEDRLQARTDYLENSTLSPSGRAE